MLGNSAQKNGRIWCKLYLHMVGGRAMERGREKQKINLDLELDG